MKKEIYGKPTIKLLRKI